MSPLWIQFLTQLSRKQQEAEKGQIQFFQLMSNPLFTQEQLMSFKEEVELIKVE
jgi:hypothetical protein